MKLPSESDSYIQVNVIDMVVQETFLLNSTSDAYEACVAHSHSAQSGSLEIETCAKFLETKPPYTRKRHFEKLGTWTTKLLPSIQQPPVLELKQLSPHLRYAYLGEPCTLPVIISNTVSEVEEERLLRVLKENKTAIRWTIADIKGISPSLCMHKILMEENCTPSIEGQSRLEGSGKERATRKDHFPLPFIDQMLEKLARHSHYYFLDGYSGYNQIPVAPEDQEKTTFTCPYGTFTYRKMSFGLYNALATFHRCMMAIFFDMIERFIEVFMDDFSEGIVLGHRVSATGIEVDKAELRVIEKLPPPTLVKGVHSFLGHAGFLREIYKGFFENH
ncbi:uncharacterized protein LOC111377951 [Olea europaea var. sylvestris]|uniref:uncharacterized protein LOC111377951 n=1 Tax=Olea europaea var. sylvestris TaxID=158386 RepID=UPI000C1D850D|nr:uncharacterized protein LOC111377951 [Olea europaea var. sylvestris]